MEKKRYKDFELKYYIQIKKAELFNNINNIAANFILYNCSNIFKQKMTLLRIIEKIILFVKKLNTMLIKTLNC